jgi:glycosyltransferase involved in cell wall biosynthesis
VRVKQFPTFRYYEFVTIAPFYAWEFIRSGYDIVVVFFADFGEAHALRLASSFVHPRLILYLTFPYESAPHRYHAYQRAGWHQQAAQILADAEYTARRGAEFFQRPVSVLPSGTDPARFRPDADKRAATRRELGLRDDAIVLLNVSALEQRKGSWRVIEALPRIRARCPSVRYLILGEGPHKPHLQARVDELGLREAVIFAGTTSDLPRYYNAADLFVMLSDSEAGSVACLEAMASGLPTVVSNTGGFAEVVNEASGRIVNLQDSSAIADAIIELAQAEDLRARLGAAGRASVVSRFSWERIAEQFDGLLQS